MNRRPYQYEYELSYYISKINDLIRVKELPYIAKSDKGLVLEYSKGSLVLLDNKLYLSGDFQNNKKLLLPNIHSYLVTINTKFNIHDYIKNNLELIDKSSTNHGIYEYAITTREECNNIYKNYIHYEEITNANIEKIFKFRIGTKALYIVGLDSNNNILAIYTYTNNKNDKTIVDLEANNPILSRVLKEYNI